ncbi:DUF4136 domain-containing protein [Aquimarina celericrescens]|uniref:DUF4136 domain-containing protein n=1 Tax=Aquimarina celericrescens TaxID=1964542 RepID=A0ABW5AU29_9FLAO|nr:DUF4136 domain-containing protein [Aquimarina celericrescens]
MKTKHLLFLTGLLVFTLFGCGPAVQTVKMSDEDLSKYSTFAYLPNSNFDDSNIGYNDKTVGSKVIERVNSNLSKAGYTLDRENPDLLVLIRTKTDTETETYTDPIYATYPYADLTPAVSPYYDPFYYTNYYDYNQIVGYETDVYKYKEGTLIVDLVDRKSKKVIWRGTASDQIYKDNNSKAISTYVDDIFDQFPNVAGY